MLALPGDVVVEMRCPVHLGWVWVKDTYVARWRCFVCDGPGVTGRRARLLEVGLEIIS
jgi:hypothetical protein